MGVFKRTLYLIVLYLGLLCCYIGAQEFYVENCTLRGGLANLFISMPVCTYTNKFLEMIGNQFIGLFVALSGVIMAMSF
jgi:hypothetical protein